MIGCSDHYYCGQLECVLVRSGQEPVVVNLDIEPVEPPESVP
jgi:hypothetical protein